MMYKVDQSSLPAVVHRYVPSYKHKHVYVRSILHVKCARRSLVMQYVIENGRYVWVIIFLYSVVLVTQSRLYIFVVQQALYLT